MKKIFSILGILILGVLLLNVIDSRRWPDQWQKKRYEKEFSYGMSHEDLIKKIKNHKSWDIAWDSEHGYIDDNETEYGIRTIRVWIDYWEIVDITVVINFAFDEKDELIYLDINKEYDGP